MEEIKMTDEDLIVSETNENGVITYANDTFCKFAEMELEELIGKNHNIVRHPDMPKWAFEWLWNIIKKDQTWYGFVKNKSKTGKYYWVFSTVYKIVNKKGEIRYISIRTAPNEEDKKTYSELYKTHFNKPPKILEKRIKGV